MIKIIRKTGSPLPPVDEIVAEPTPPKPKEPTKAEIKDRWEKFPAPNAPLVKCAWCGHMYIRPCSEEPQAERCINYGWFREKMKAKGKA